MDWGVSLNLAVELWLEAGYLQVRIPFCEVFVVVVAQDGLEYASASLCRNRHEPMPAC